MMLHFLWTLRARFLDTQHRQQTSGTTNSRPLSGGCSASRPSASICVLELSDCGRFIKHPLHEDTPDISTKCCPAQPWRQTYPGDRQANYPREGIRVHQCTRLEYIAYLSTYRVWNKPFSSASSPRLYNNRPGASNGYSLYLDVLVPLTLSLSSFRLPFTPIHCSPCSQHSCPIPSTAPASMPIPSQIQPLSTPIHS
jgi:hypothetical protein